MRHSIVSSSRSGLMFLAVAVLILTTLACGFEGGAFSSTPIPTSVNKVMIPAVSGGGAAQPKPTSVPSTSQTMIPDVASGPTETILITAPQPKQGARGVVRVEGLSDLAATQLNVLLRDAQGTVIPIARPLVQPKEGQPGAFSTGISVPPDLARQVGRIQLYAISPRDNNISHLSSVEVELNGEGQVAVPLDAHTPEAIAMIFPSPNAEVKGRVKVAAATWLGPRIVIEVRDAQGKTVGRVEQTVDLKAGSPAQIMAEVPIQVSTAGPGRVLVYAVNPNDGSTEHLNSVEVNLVP